MHFVYSVIQCCWLPFLFFECRHEADIPDTACSENQARGKRQFPLKQSRTLIAKKVLPPPRRRSAIAMYWKATHRNLFEGAASCLYSASKIIQLIKIIMTSYYKNKTVHLRVTISFQRSSNVISSILYVSDCFWYSQFFKKKLHFCYDKMFWVSRLVTKYQPNSVIGQKWRNSGYWQCKIGSKPF